MPERNTMKKIQELQQVKGDAYDYYIAGNEDTDLFEKIFLVDDIVEEICKPDKYFLIGEKGSGKTAYSVYMSKSDKINSFCSISLVENTLYQRFLNMKRQKALELSSFKDVWINLIYLILAEKIRKEYGETFLKEYYWKPLFWSDSYFVTTVSENSLQMVQEYIKNQ